MKLLTLLYYLFRHNQHRRPMPGSSQCRTQSEKSGRTPQRPCGFRAFFFPSTFPTILEPGTGYNQQ